MTLTCAFAGCDEDWSVERVHTPSGAVYHYCENHDPLDDEDTWQYAEGDE